MLRGTLMLAHIGLALISTWSRNLYRCSQICLLVQNKLKLAPIARSAKHVSTVERGTIADSGRECSLPRTCVHTDSAARQAFCPATTKSSFLEGNAGAMWKLPLTSIWCRYLESEELCFQNPTHLHRTMELFLYFYIESRQRGTFHIVIFM
jgi:hypothetical protein